MLTFCIYTLLIYMLTFFGYTPLDWVLTLWFRWNWEERKRKAEIIRKWLVFLILPRYVHSWHFDLIKADTVSRHTHTWLHMQALTDYMGTTLIVSIHTWSCGETGLLKQSQKLQPATEVVRIADWPLRIWISISHFVWYPQRLTTVWNFLCMWLMQKYT